MKKKSKIPKKIKSSVQDENPEWTAEDFKRARPAMEVEPDLAAWSLRRTRSTAPEKNKVPVSIRLSPEVIAHFRSMGTGWQTRLDNALRLLISDK
jgi:uncharacterized protein (DUF4415 family)